MPRFPLLYDYASVDAREQSSPQCRPIRFFVWPVRYASKIASKGTRACCDPVSHLKIAGLQAHSAAHFTALSACSSDKVREVSRKNISDLGAGRNKPGSKSFKPNVQYIMYYYSRLLGVLLF